MISSEADAVARGTQSAAVDLNCDLGESFGAWTMGDDEAMFALISSANVACGFHAGDPMTMLASCRLAVEHEVSVGAHVSYRDLAGFGRRAMDIAPAQLYADVLYQLCALDGIARTAGTAVRYVKPHGALYNRIVHDAEQAAAVLAAVRDFNPALPLLGLPGSAILALAQEAGQPLWQEAFVDRGYQPDGTLTPRGTPGALLSDVGVIAERAVRMVTDGTVAATDGTIIELKADSLCVHGDTPGAVQMAGAVCGALADAGVRTRAFA